MFDPMSAAILNLMHNGDIDDIFRVYEGQKHDRKPAKDLIPVTSKDINGLFLIVFIKVAAALTWSTVKKICLLIGLQTRNRKSVMPSITISG